MDWTTDRNLIEQLTKHEDCKLKPYRCTAGKLTIGVGRNLDDRGITAAEAHHLLGNDIAKCAKELDNSVQWWRQMNLTRQRVILDMCFNLGLEGLLKFTNTLEAMKNEHYSSAADNMLQSKWAKQVGQRAKTLATMMRVG